MQYLGTKLIILELTNYLIEKAKTGLSELAMESGGYLDIIAARAQTGQTGAIWQERQLDRCHGDFTKMLSIYYENQRSNQPVHTWQLAT